MYHLCALSNLGSTHGVTLIVGNEYGNQSSKFGHGCLDFTSTNTLGKGMNLTILSSAIGKQQGRLGSLTLV